MNWLKALSLAGSGNSPAIGGAAWELPAQWRHGRFDVSSGSCAAATERFTYTSMARLPSGLGSPSGEIPRLWPSAPCSTPGALTRCMTADMKPWARSRDQRVSILQTVVRHITDFRRPGGTSGRRNGASIIDSRLPAAEARGSLSNSCLSSSTGPLRSGAGIFGGGFAPGSAFADGAGSAGGVAEAGSSCLAVGGRLLGAAGDGSASLGSVGAAGLGSSGPS